MRKSFTSTKPTGNSSRTTSYDVFLLHAGPDNNGRSRILSKECFENWVTTRKKGVKRPEHSFRKALIAHLCGRDGRKPFPPDLEALITIELRKKQPWPCFKDSPVKSIRSTGSKGFRENPFHAGNLEQKQTAASEIEPIKSIPINAGYELNKCNVSSPLRQRPFYSNEPDLRFHNFNSMPNVYKNEFTGEDDLKLPTFAKFHSFSSTAELTFPHPVTLLNSGRFSGAENPDLPATPEISYHQHTNDFVLESAMKKLDATIDCLLSDYLPSDSQPTTHDESIKNTQPDPSSQGSVLDTFQDVSVEEVEKVEQLKNLLHSVFVDYWQKYPTSYTKDGFPTDVCGEVKLLRMLRFCHGKIDESVKEMTKFLQWREAKGLEHIRQDIIANNYNVQELKDKLILRNKNTFMPFYAQEENGDIIDVYALHSHQDRYLAYMDDYMVSHTTMCEYRSIVLDRLSYIKRRVIQVKVFVDVSVTSGDGTSGNWWGAINVLMPTLVEFSELYLRWNGGMIGNIFLFGKDRFFASIAKYLLPMMVRRFFDGEFAIAYTSEEWNSVLQSCLGPAMKWPKMLGGGCKLKVLNGVGSIKLSSINPRNNFPA